MHVLLKSYSEAFVAFLVGTAEHPVTYLQLQIDLTTALHPPALRFNFSLEDDDFQDMMKPYQPPNTQLNTSCHESSEKSNGKAGIFSEGLFSLLRRLLVAKKTSNETRGGTTTMQLQSAP